MWPNVRADLFTRRKIINQSLNKSLARNSPAFTFHFPPKKLQPVQYYILGVTSWKQSFFLWEFHKLPQLLYTLSSCFKVRNFLTNSLFSRDTFFIRLVLLLPRSERNVISVMAQLPNYCIWAFPLVCLLIYFLWGMHAWYGGAPGYFSLLRQALSIDCWGETRKETCNFAKGIGCIRLAMQLVACEIWDDFIEAVLFR